jgi:mannose-6-phosphate isomerase-like protein (cupin superfamily)
MKQIKKPWGYEILVEKNKKYMFKKLFMKKNHRCSLQYHRKKTETIFVLKGKLKIFFGKSEKNLKSKIFKPQQTITLLPKIIHRMQALVDTTYLECSSPEFYDVVRLSDDYKRKS